MSFLLLRARWAAAIHLLPWGPGTNDLGAVADCETVSEDDLVAAAAAIAARSAACGALKSHAACLLLISCLYQTLKGKTS